ncbi:hypothetical protein L6452_14029 [Arctium lappa]|uniref:Uncharacterized protein n=1 Tax=Arctium lappa TaxID=4217 RepID=A0ACB9CJQ7_ARCLA|nr:hypothetical protein L6452_14029 [Arctium lappa]
MVIGIENFTIIYSLLSEWSIQATYEGNLQISTTLFKKIDVDDTGIVQDSYLLRDTTASLLVFGSSLYTTHCSAELWLGLPHGLWICPPSNGATTRCHHRTTVGTVVGPLIRPPIWCPDWLFSSLKLWPCTTACVVFRLTTTGDGFD